MSPTGSDGPFKPISPNPFIVGNPVRDSTMFFGREAEFERGPGAVHLEQVERAAVANDDVAGDGEAAIATARRLRSRLDLLVTDVVMPRLDGCELARRLTEQLGVRTLEDLELEEPHQEDHEDGDQGQGDDLDGDERHGAAIDVGRRYGGRGNTSQVEQREPERRRQERGLEIDRDHDAEPNRVEPHCQQHRPDDGYNDERDFDEVEHEAEQEHHQHHHQYGHGHDHGIRHRRQPAVVGRGRHRHGDQQP